MRDELNDFDPNQPHSVLDAGSTSVFYAEFTGDETQADCLDAGVHKVLSRDEILDLNWCSTKQIVIEHAHMVERVSMRSMSQVFTAEKLMRIQDSADRKGITIWLYPQHQTPKQRKIRNLTKSDENDVRSIAGHLSSPDFALRMKKFRFTPKTPKEQSRRWLFRQATNAIIDVAKNYHYSTVGDHALGLDYERAIDHVSEFIFEKCGWFDGKGNATQQMASDLLPYIDRKQSKSESAFEQFGKFSITQVYSMVACIMNPANGLHRTHECGTPVSKREAFEWGYTTSPYHLRAGVASAHVKNFRTANSCKGLGPVERRRVQSGISAICESIIQFSYDCMSGDASPVWPDAVTVRKSVVSSMTCRQETLFD